MRWNFPTRAALALCAGFLVSGSAGSGGPLYTIIDLGTLGGATSVALGINNLSQVVGGADLPNGKRHAFLWQYGTMTDLGTLPGDQYTEAWDINNLGVVCGGSSFSASSWRAFRWQSGVMTQLPHLGGMVGDSTAFAVNDAGIVVGDSNKAPVVWQNNAVMSLFTTYGVGGTPWDINSASQVSLGPHLLDLATGDADDLGTLGGNLTQALGVNSAGQVTGKSEREPGTAIFHAFVWQAGSMTDLSLLMGFDWSHADAINASGQVVGFGGWFDRDVFYFLYVPGIGMLNLESLIPAESGWSNLRPRDINDAGQIVGYGAINSASHAFLMKPVVIPTTSQVGVIVLASAVLFAGARLLRRGSHRAE